MPSQTDMSTSKLDQGHPIGLLFAPAHSNASSLSKPANGALNHLPAGRMSRIFRNRQLFFQRFIPSAALFDMGLILSFCHGFMYIIVVVPFISAQMLLDNRSINSPDKCKPNKGY
jgi:hypothetical protein